MKCSPKVRNVESMAVAAGSHGGAAAGVPRASRIAQEEAWRSRAWPWICRRGKLTNMIRDCGRRGAAGISAVFCPAHIHQSSIKIEPSHR